MRVPKDMGVPKRVWEVRVGVLKRTRDGCPFQPMVGEGRHLVLGTSSAGRLLVVSYAERPPRTRRISARPGTRYEGQQYEQGT